MIDFMEDKEMDLGKAIELPMFQLFANNCYLGFLEILASSIYLNMYKEGIECTTESFNTRVKSPPQQDLDLTLSRACNALIDAQEDLHSEVLDLGADDDADTISVEKFICMPAELMKVLLGGKFPEVDGFNWGEVSYFVLEEGDWEPYDDAAQILPAPGISIKAQLNKD